MSKLIELHTSGDYKKTLRFLEAIRERRIFNMLNKYGERGVSMLSAATPKRTGKTAASWSYEVVMEEGTVGLEFHNTSMGSDGKTPIAILIQMGHGTRNGGYVPPTDYINPVIQPLFDELTDEVAKAVNSLV